MAIQRLFKIADANNNLTKLNISDVYDKSVKKTLDVILSEMNTDLTSVKTSLNTFLNGSADGGDIDRLIELVNAIEANKDSIDALLADNLKASDLVNDLTTGGTTKALTAEQGKALKDLIDALEDSTHSHANKSVLDGFSVNSATGNAVFNNVELDGKTGIDICSSLSDATAFDGKIRLVIEEFDESA